MRAAISNHPGLTRRVAVWTVRSSLLILAGVGLQACPNGEPLAPPEAPAIGVEPQSATVVSGSPASFSVTATGTAPLTYQWRRTGTDIAGGTGTSYGLPAAGPADSGAVFQVMVTNAAGSDTSAAATLTVLVPPAITVQPANQTVVSGAVVSFGVAATGSGPLSYQWEVNGSPVPGVIGTFPTLGLTTNPTNDGALVRVTVSNAAGSDTSAAATLTVLVPPTITLQPVSQSVANSSTVFFSVTATGSGPLSYQWQGNGTDLGGANSQVLALAAVPSLSGTVFRVIVSNAAGADTSANAALTVLNPPTITTQPASQTVVSGASVSFSVTATGDAPLSYQWHRNGLSIPGMSGAVLGILAASPTDSGSVYSVMVSNASGDVMSDGAILTVLTPPTITGDPVSQTVPSFATVNFSVGATGSGPLSYQWQANGTDVAGATSATFTTSAVALLNGAVFRAIVSNAVGADTSAGATLTIANPPVITAQPASLTVVSGAGASFTVTATGDAPLSYQWQRNGADIGGATGTAYTLTTAPADDGAVFQVVVSNPAGSATSATATLTVLVSPAITVQPLSLTVASGDNASFVVSATGTAPLNYQWRRNGADIVGANAPVYNLFAAGPADNGALFRVVVSNAAGSATSADATLNVTTPLVTSAAVAAGGSHSLALKADGTVWAWGGDGFGQLGNGLPMIDVTGPVQVSGLTNVVQIAAGESHSLALRSDGTVWAWGQGSSSQLGNGGTSGSATPVQVTGLTSVTWIAAGRRHNLAARADGTVWAWGWNFYGQLGDGTGVDRDVPVLAPMVIGTCVPVNPMVCPPGPQVQALAAGWTHSLVQLSDLIAWGWGDNFRGEIGNGIGTGGSTSPIQIGALAGLGFSQFAAGGEFSMALQANGTILSWGTNFNGVLGVNVGAVSTPTPTLIPTLSNVTQVAAGFEHALALKSDGTVWGWGRNDAGQITGFFSSLSTPTQVGFQSGAFLTGVQRIGAGVNHTVVLKTDGTVWAFGDDHNCKLGRGCVGTTFSRDPVQVAGLRLF